MYRFFVKPEQIDMEEKKVHITGSDVNHIKNVLRMRQGETILISAGDNLEYTCLVGEMEAEEVIADISYVQEVGMELPSKIYLFQGLPKSDKMEMIIQKAVELGVYEVIPVSTARAVVEQIEPGQSIGILIGPEGGFTPEEIELAMAHQVQPITLGKRILRTETAGMTVLSILMFLLEGKE